MDARRLWGRLLSSGLLLALLPSFVADSLSPDRKRRRTHKLHPTSYLDGLRGLAAFSVFAYHYTDYNHKFFLPAYGSNPEDLGSSPLQLPYIRAMYAGTPMVHVFFVISGFALAYRPLRCLYQSSRAAVSTSSSPPAPRAISRCAAALASAALRRPVRLFGPPLVLTLIDVVLVRLGFMRSFLQAQPSLWAQLLDWARDALDTVTWSWDWDEDARRSKYNPHLWTIPIEFAHSMLLFLVLLVVARARTPLVRRLLLGATMAYALVLCGRWATFEFVGGALLADLHLAEGALEGEADHVSDPSSGSPKYVSTRRLGAIVTHAFLLAFAGYIFSWPPRPDDITPSFAWLRSLAPPHYASPDGTEPHGEKLWFALAALALVWTCGRLRLLRRLLERGAPQYAGRISFAFYILQHPVLNICEHPVLGAPWKPATAEHGEELGWGVRGLTGQSNPLQRTVCWFLGLAVLGSILVWMADVFWRAVDVPFVKMARSLDALVFVDDGEDEATLPLKR